MKKITELKEIQKIELELLESIDYVCRKNNLRYFLAGGTLLGSIRHKGFIPWDNDIDVSMPRKDYDCFVKIFDKEAKEKYPYYKILSMEEGKVYCCPFAKVEDTRTLLHEPHQKFKSSEVGLFVDIFPIDGLNSDPGKRTQELQYVRKTCQRIGLSFAPFDNLSFSEAIKLVVLKLLYRKGSRIKKYEKTIDLLRCYDFNNADYIASTFGLRANKEIILQSTFAEIIEVEFENKLFYAPKGWEIYLKQMYGDFMELPSEEDRKAPHEFDVYWR